jgi:carbon-monoxide dehydrogenase catalytic subunit
MSCDTCNEKKRSLDPGVNEMFKKAAKEQIETAWDRYEQQLPLCGFGELGVCCRNCLQGPCRINPFGDPKTGICGADADLIVARNLLRTVTGGSASHTDHAYSAIQCLRLMTEGKADYQLKGIDKIGTVAAKLGIDAKGKKPEEIAHEIAMTALADFGNWTDEPMKWLTATAPAERVEVWKKLGVLPRNPDRE